jgi:hypothetical protein
VDVEPEMGGLLVYGFLLGSEEIQQQGAEPGALELVSHVLIPPAVPAAAASVREQHDPDRLIGNLQLSLEDRGAGPDPDDTALGYG